MSRTVIDPSPDISIIRGKDHILGNFVQIQDRRYANSDKDEQGEGYVMDWDELWGFTINLIHAEIIDLHDDVKLLELANKIDWTLSKKK